MLEMHVCPASQTTPHLPQFSSSVARSVHALPHATSGATHVHAPPRQVKSWSQAMPQTPQFASSVCVSVHVPLQSISPATSQAHTARAHEAPTAHGWSHAPQLSWSNASVAHPEGQSVSPSGQGDRTQLEAMQILPPKHATPQAPQFCGSESSELQTPLHLT
jgi:hypothetical protein